MSIFKAYIQSSSDNSIQGIGLRNLIEKIAAKKNIIGQIKNRKQEKDVELQAVFSTREEFKAFLDLIKKETLDELKIEIEYSDIISSDEPDAFFEQKFKVVREDDLKEMVWALEGAQRQFEKFTKEFEKLRATEEKNKAFKLKGLENELKRLKDVFVENKSVSVLVKHTAIEQFLVAPFDSDLEKTLNELSSLLYDIVENNGKDKKINNLNSELKEQTNKLIDEAINKVKLSGKPSQKEL